MNVRAIENCRKYARVWRLSQTLCIGAFFAISLGALRLSAYSFGPQEQGSQPGDDHDAQQKAIAVPLPKGKKLFLTDGTFQIVREYQRQGDRVRYYSVERSSWEEIPARLLDWVARQKA